MRERPLDVPILQPDEKVLGVAYLTEEQEIVFEPHPGATEVVLVEPGKDCSGPWAVRQRPVSDPH
jgi:hypothetical protein